VEGGGESEGGVAQRLVLAGLAGNGMYGIGSSSNSKRASEQATIPQMSFFQAFPRDVSFAFHFILLLLLLSLLLLLY